MKRTNIQALRKIDIDLITELKAEGRHSDARALLRAYYRDLERTKKDEYNNMQKHQRLVYKSKGLCSCGKEKPEKSSKCVSCINLIYDRCRCGKRKMKNALSCKDCKNCYVPHPNKSKNFFYKKLGMLNGIRIGKIYRTGELMNIMKIGDYCSFIIFIKKAVGYGIFRKVKNGKYMYV